MRENQPLILAVPKGRILKELEPLLSGVGIIPEPAFNDPSAR
ncbi:MAG: ATP phosphoribosyltransferase, partial [Alphaproteobacteria bacterium]